MHLIHKNYFDSFLQKQPQKSGMKIFVTNNFC